MTNTSATGGYLTPDPAGPIPLYDDALDDFVQSVFVGLTGIPGEYVRPRYQVKPPKQPAAGVNWCAVGVMQLDPDASPVLDHEQQHLARHEEIHVLASFYGPNAYALAAQARDGLALGQNNDSLILQLMTYVNNDTMRKLPELVGEQWISRVDLPVKFRRQVKRAYAVQTIAAPSVALTTS